MDLWSKGLGRLVLRMRLSERSKMDVEDGHLVMYGTMGKPTFWDWSVNLDERDVVDFLVLLKRPDVVRYLVEDASRWALLRSAAKGALVFAWRTARLFLEGPPDPLPSGATDPAPTDAPPTPAPESARAILEEKS
jgi:hypothetical protein